LTTLNFATDHCFYERSGDYDTLMVLFNYWGQEVSVRSHGRYVATSPCNKLYLHSGKNDWFQNGIPEVANSFEGLLDFCHGLRGRFPEKRFVFAGHSMGAFAALGCGLFSDADRILASVPEVDLCQPGSLSAKYLDERELRYPSIRALLAENKRTPIDVIVGARDEGDMRAARLILAIRPVSLIELDCAHETFVDLRDAGLLELVFQAFVEGRDLGEALNQAKPRA
jgi:hypothetical protein